MAGLRIRKLKVAAIDIHLLPPESLNFDLPAPTGELVAELGAAFLCADLELKLEDRNDHAAYIGSWLKVLKNDKRAIFQAAAHAQRAVTYLHSLQPAGISAEREAA